tara:strand:- start:4116 stop:4613 length:498 start_codon:yes stop_codon:yes gene_type:complete
MAENFSFDIVSDFDRQELVNTLDQVKREISQRYDLKGTDTSLDLEKENIFITTNSELTLNSVIDILRQKATKRKLSLKIFEFQSLDEVSGNKVKQNIKLKKGLDQEIAKKISKELRNQIKKINVSIQGDSLRVSSKSKNDLQTAISMLEGFEESFDIPLQTNNFR